MTFLWNSLNVRNISETVNKRTKVDDDFLKSVDFEVEIKFDSEFGKEDIS